jgi:hypothetical protein
VAGRAPFELSLGGVGGREQRLGVDLRRAVLEEGQRQVVPRQARVATEGPPGVVGGAEAVHEQERHLGPDLGAEGQYLARGEVEKAEAFADLEQGFGPLEAHRGPEAAVELEHGHAPQGLGPGFSAGLQRGRVGDLVERPDRLFGQRPAVAVSEAGEVEPEGRDRGLGDPRPLHALDKGGCRVIPGPRIRHLPLPFERLFVIIQE